MPAKNAQSMIRASFLGDSLSLGAHWIYDQEAIKRKIGRVNTLLAPLPASQHASQQAGAFTHYGDQTLILMQSLAGCKGFDLQDFAARWRRFWEKAQSYRDQATKGTLANMQAGKGPEASGSQSNDLAGAARIAPLIYALGQDEQTLIQAARAQTAMTHADQNVVDSAEFFTRVVLEVFNGLRPVSAVEKAAAFSYAHLPVKKWVRTGLDAAAEESTTAIQDLGKTCHAPHAFPGTVQLIARHEDNLKEALVQCVMAGGDSAARGLLVGMVLGAFHGEAAVPAEWKQELQAGEEIESLLQDIAVWAQ